MINGNARRVLVTRLHSVVLVSVFAIVAAVVAVPIYSVRSSSLPGGPAKANVTQGTSPTASRTTATTVFNPAIAPPSALLSFLPIPQPSPEEIAIFASDCTTPKTTFTLGEQVCAKTLFVTETDRWVNWIDSSANIVYGGPTATPITSNTSQNFLYTPTYTGLWKAAIADSTDSAIVSADFTVEQPQPIATYDSNCILPKTDFLLGDTVCAKADGIPPSVFPWRITWSDPAGFIRQSDPASTNNQTTYTYQIPEEATTVVNGQTVDNRGSWRVNVTRPNGAVRNTARFTVHEALNPLADVFIQKFRRDISAIYSGQNVAFVIVVQNDGPDPATAVHLIDSLPSGATLASFNQDSGPQCLPLNTQDCTIATLTNGERAEFTAIYTITGGAGTYQTSASIVSTTSTDPVTANNSASAQYTVQPGSPPGSCSLTCPDDIVAFANTEEGGQRGAHVTYSAPEGTGSCGTITTSPASGSFFPVGTTTVTATSELNDGTCQFTVTVEEATGNVSISCPANKTATANNVCEAIVNVGSPSVSGDNVTFHGNRSDGKPMYNCDCFPLSPNQVDDACDENGACSRKADPPFSAGVTTITWIAYSHDAPGPYATPEDELAHRNGSASCVQTITVNDVTPPTIGATDQTVSADANCQAVIPDYSSTVADNCACDSSDTSEACEGHTRFTVTQTPAPGTVVGPGAHPVHITANDGSSNNGGNGNTTEKDITFTVNDTTPPTITCPANKTVNTEPGTCAAHVVTGTATATDNCDSTPTITGTRSDGRPLTDTYPGGTTTITWRATDDYGNYSECTQTVTVEDHENPVIVCPAPTTASANASCQAAIPDRRSQATTSDNCGPVTVTQSPAPGTMVGLGTHTITLTATDSSGNTSTCQTTFTVVDTTAPTFTFTGTQSMWPPNHKYQTFTTANLVASVQDNCNSIPVSSVVITKVTSDEIENGNGDGNTLNDIVIAANCKSVQLRSEREGNSNGRVYTIFFSVTDAAGNKGTGTTKVVVPHNPGETAVDSGPHYTVTSNCP